MLVSSVDSLHCVKNGKLDSHLISVSVEGKKKSTYIVYVCDRERQIRIHICRDRDRSRDRKKYAYIYIYKERETDRYIERNRKYGSIEK